MRKYVYCSALVLMTFSAFAAGPSYISDGATCSTTSLSGATGGNVNLRTVYEAKSVPITWESNGTTYTTTSCTYDTQLQLPAAPSARLGYTFQGWTLYEESAFDYGETCASSVESTVQNNVQVNTSDGAEEACLDLNGNGDCVGKINLAVNAPVFGITEAGQWGVKFGYGHVIGEALCSSTGNDTGEQPNTNSNGPYCWCRAMGYRIYKDKVTLDSMCAVSAPVWVYLAEAESAADCARICALECVNGVGMDSLFRGALFGIQEKPGVVKE